MRCLFYWSPGIFGGALLGVKSGSGLCFYDWETQELICRIDIQPKNVFWSENGEMCCITTDESYFVLKYSQENVVFHETLFVKTVIFTAFGFC